MAGSLDRQRGLNASGLNEIASHRLDNDNPLLLNTDTKRLDQSHGIGTVHAANRNDFSTQC